MPNPLILLHGYSDTGHSFAKWHDVLEKSGYNAKDIHICSYVTLNNEVTVDDIADAFDRSLRERGLDKGEFDAIVHSTGMLVIRAWLTAPHMDDARRKRLKHLVALAPATFGSPLAAEGRSFLGRVFKGNRKIGPDFLDSGSLVLSNLELGSTYTWNLAHKDLIGAKPFYGPDNDTPYVFVFQGTEDYGKLAEIFDRQTQEGGDGCVRWSASALNTRKIVLDLTRGGEQRFHWSEWTNIDIPMVPVGNVNHSQILQNPPEGLIGLVKEALAVDSKEDFDRFHRESVPKTGVVKAGEERLKKSQWQQFIVHAVDDRGNGISDFDLELFSRNSAGEEKTLKAVEEDIHAFEADKSYRCFHVHLNRVTDALALSQDEIFVRVIASADTSLVGYQGFGTDATVLNPTTASVELRVTSHVRPSGGEHPSFFFPFTTTLVEIRLNREPVRRADGSMDLFQFVSLESGQPEAAQKDKPEQTFRHSV